MRDRILTALESIQGLALSRSGRAASLQWFQFGRLRELTTRSGRSRLVGERALHVECAWRVSGPAGIVVASRDRYYPAGDPYHAPAAFHWDTPGGNRSDQRMAAFLDDPHTGSLVVTAVGADQMGGFQLQLGSSYRLEAFPDDSLDAEHWRLFTPDSDEPHFVVGGSEAGRE